MSKYTDSDIKKCANLYVKLRSIKKVSEEARIPFASTQRLLYKSGVAIQKLGDAHRGRPWTAARRKHHPEKPKEDTGGLRGGDLLSARKRGNKSLSSHGYVMVNSGKRERQYEHVILAEKALGRKLKSGEVVHHINCDKTDNRPENLIICTRRYHLKLHARMRRHPFWSQISSK